MKAVRTQENAYDAIVIGSGVGGLGLAAILAKHGRRALVLERHHIAGGLTHVFRRRDFEWDCGVHYVGKVHDEGDPLRRVFDHATDGALSWAKFGPVYDRVIYPDAEFAFVEGRAALEASLAARFPAEARAIAAYLDSVARVASASRMYFMARALPPLLAPLLDPVLTWSFRRQATRTTRAALSSMISDPRLASVLAGQWGNYGLPPGASSFAMHALMAEFYLDGASYPVGGSARIGESLVAVIERAGGTVARGCEVERIVVDRGRAVGVEVEGGEVLRARSIVSDAGAHRTFRELLAPHDRPHRLLARLERLQASTGHVALYLGLEGSPRDLELPIENLWLHSAYDHDASAAACAQDGRARLPFIFVSSAAARDPDWPRRHAGRSTLTAISPMPFTHFARFAGTRWRRRGAEYEEEKARLGEELLQTVLRAMPQLRGKVRHAEVSTPLSTAHFTGRSDGAMYGLAHNPARFLERGLRACTPIPGLYLVGQDLTTVGVGSSMMSAVICASVLLRRNVLGDVSAARPSRDQRVPQAASLRSEEISP